MCFFISVPYSRQLRQTYFFFLSYFGRSQRNPVGVSREIFKLPDGIHRAAGAVVNLYRVSALHGIVPTRADQRVDNVIDRYNVHHQILVANDGSQGASAHLRHYTCRMILFIYLLL